MPKDIPLEERIIFALDVSTEQEAKQWVETLEAHIRFFKVGFQLFLGGWFDIVEWIRDRDLKVFLDLKFFERKELGDNFLVVAPGIRPVENVDDQKRTVDVRQAFENGADYVVVGRPIRDASDPVAVTKSMQGQIQSVLSIIPTS
jgi:orotidine-5'-phosphate decarboxylase